MPQVNIYIYICTQVKAGWCAYARVGGHNGADGSTSHAARRVQPHLLCNTWELALMPQNLEDWNIAPVPPLVR